MEGMETASPGAATAAPTPDERRQRVFGWLDARGIAYTWYEHPEAPTIEAARRYWRDDGSKHCTKATATTSYVSTANGTWPSTTWNTA